MYLEGGMHMERIEQQKKFVIQFLYWAFLLLIAVFVYTFLWPVIWPFVIAFVMAWAFEKPIVWIKEHTNVPRTVAVVGVVLMFVLVVIGVLLLFGTSIVSVIRNVAKLLPVIFDKNILPLLDSSLDWLETLLISIDPSIAQALEGTIDSAFTMMSDEVVRVCGSVVTSLGSMITTIPSLFMKSMILVIATIFISIDFAMIKNYVLKLVPEKGKKILHEMVPFFGRTVPKCILSYVLIFILTCVELWLGFTLLRLNNAFLLAILIAVLDILPVLGTGTILIPWALISLLRGNLWLGIGLVILYVAITVIRNIVEPHLVGKQMELHPVVTFASMLIGLHFLGIIGLFLTPLFVSFLAQLSKKKIIGCTND